MVAFALCTIAPVDWHFDGRRSLTSTFLCPGLLTFAVALFTLSCLPLSVKLPHPFSLCISKTTVALAHHPPDVRVKVDVCEFVLNMSPSACRFSVAWGSRVFTF